MQRNTLFRPLLLVTALLSTTAFANESNVISHPISKGLYELSYGQSPQQLYVASAGARQEAGGAVYVLNPQDLTVEQIIKEPLKPFGMAIDNAQHILYTGNTRDGSITAIDLKTQKIIAQQVVESRQRSETFRPPQIREIAVDPTTHQVYATGVGADSVVWVLDGKSLEVIKTITGVGKMATGLALDPQQHTLYLTNADAEWIKIDTQRNTVVQRTKLAIDGEHMLLNISLDTAGHRAFVSDFKQPQVLVIDTQNSKVLTSIKVPESLGVLFNPHRQELYVTHRQAGLINIIDTKTYQVKRTIKADGMPNSLALSDKGDVLYVSVKQASSREKEATQPDTVLRITL
ncbi:YncE family protein [Rosenbergiella australiborealis]|uniref:7-bladed beta-propeller protein YncE n=1 Tax=Rosenbergiella australiborealis TaxID=1544696 RepID=UPI001F4D65DE|nr:YncE family protein [Rosenbergiella australiborealis]